MKLTRLVIKDYNTQTNDHIVNLIGSNKFHDCHVFLRCNVKEGDVVKDYYLCSLCGKRSPLHKSDHLVTIHDCMLKQHS